MTEALIVAALIGLIGIVINAPRIRAFLHQRFPQAWKWLGYDAPKKLLTRVVRGDGADIAADAPTAEIDTYLGRIESLYSELHVAGFSQRMGVPIDLEELHVPLRAVLHLAATGKASFADAEDAEKKLGERGETHEIAMTEAFDHAEKRGRQGLVILGDPGSGKTTHLLRVLLWCLRRGPESLGLPAGMLPVFLPLRELEDLEAGLDAFIESQLDHPHLHMPEGFGKRLLARGNLLFLLDGLDEVADADHRAHVVRWIDEALVAHPQCYFVVTCRFAGYTKEARLSAKLLELHLRPLDADQAERFIHNWYRIVETGLRGADEGEPIAETKATALVERLKQTDFRAARVFALTRNPLLLANLCLLHRDRGGLPRRRGELYEECIDLLLERWHEAVGLVSRVSAKDGRRVLQPAALWMHGEEGRMRASAAELAPVIEPDLAAVRWDAGSASDFLRAVRDDSGLLTGWDQERYGFMHLGFQEYLAAREVRRRHFAGEGDALRELASRHGESWWQEVALLLVGLDDPTVFPDYVREIAKLPSFAEHPHLLDALIEDAAEISAAPFVELIETHPGEDGELWARQLVALKLLERLGPDQVDSLRAGLATHPSPELRAWVAGQARAAERASLVTENGGVELVEVPGGTFLMGSPASEQGRYDDESPRHTVDVRQCLLGRYPVTNEEYARFLAAHPDAVEPSEWGNPRLNQARQPVVGVTWDEARLFCAWAGGRLPSEAEWEYAARAGTTTRFYHGDDEPRLREHAWYFANSGSTTHPVGQKVPNDFDVHDMLGNVYEWCQDGSHAHYDGAPTDGSAWGGEKAEQRMLRGGSFNELHRRLRAAYRDRGFPDSRIVGLGFRVVWRVAGGQQN